MSAVVDLRVGQRVVVEPKLSTAPGWAYHRPVGVLLARCGAYCRVLLDSGVSVEVASDNLTRWDSFRARQRRWTRPAARRPAPRPALAGADEPTLPFDGGGG